MAIFFGSLIARLKNSQLTTVGIVNVFETSLTDSRIQAEHEHISADDIQNPWQSGIRDRKRYDPKANPKRI